MSRMTFFSKSTFILLTSIVFLLACERKSPQLFLSLGSDETGIEFRNDLKFDKKFNIYTYRNYYNGGGVAAADFNNDGMTDLYFTSNQSANKLYINKGNLKFEDVTLSAGVSGTRAWSTGVSVADVNGDGWLDIYVCNSGDIDGDNKQNELFINNGDLTFSEQAEKYGLADRGFGTHAVFFDFDKDGDLDVYLLNNSYTAIGNFNLMNNIRDIRDSVGGDKFFIQEEGAFRDASEQVGIYGSLIGFGLGATAGDVNGDGWIDLFISNDFFERDYLYINQQNGTFKEELTQRFGSISAASMGADMADINNDLTPDLFVTDMLPEPDARLKQVTMFESYDKYQYKLQNSYYHQFSRNMLHLNNGDGTFVEIGRQMGVDATDWSWGALFVDMNNDGYKDIFVANGIYQDITDLDYLNFIADEETKRKIITREGVDYEALVKPIPITPVPNYAFQNHSGVSFTNMAKEWGLGEPSHSNGAVYADLDNDGDLELVVSCINGPALVYKNQSRELQPEQSHFLQVQLFGESRNVKAIGAKVLVSSQGKRQLIENIPSRGFQSSIDTKLTFGLGTETEIDTLLIVWPRGKRTIITQVKADQLIQLYEKEAVQEISKMSQTVAISSKVTPILAVRHQENNFIDFDRDRLLYHMRSSEGPAIAVGDVNGDGLDDFYIGGAKSFAGKIILQDKNGEFKATEMTSFEQDKMSEDTEALFCDIDRDGDLDLLVGSGSNEYGILSPELADRLYLNDGTGFFSKEMNVPFGNNLVATGALALTDYDRDGDIDLFSGNRFRPFAYGEHADGLLYSAENNKWIDKTAELAPGLKGIGMITDAVWQDLNADEWPDLILVGEWMSPKVFYNRTGKLEQVDVGLENYLGWWYTLEIGDFDKDGTYDMLLGNHGMNSYFQPSKISPLYMYVSDFDENGGIEHILSRLEKGKDLPYALKHDLVAQMPSLKKKFLKYTDYREKTVQEIFPENSLKKAKKLEANWFYSSIAWGKGDGTFELVPLPTEFQRAPIYSFSLLYQTEDKVQFISGGNLYRVKPQAGRYEANSGYVIQITNDRKLSFISSLQTGINWSGEVRAMSYITLAGKPGILVARNHDYPLLISLD